MSDYLLRLARYRLRQDKKREEAEAADRACKVRADAYRYTERLRLLGLEWYGLGDFPQRLAELGVRGRVTRWRTDCTTLSLWTVEGKGKEATLGEASEIGQAFATLGLLDPKPLPVEEVAEVVEAVPLKLAQAEQICEQRGQEGCLCKLCGSVAMVEECGYCARAWGEQ